MNSVATAILKNKLSAYLRKVRGGARFVVTDRGVPVAKLVPLAGPEEETLDEKLAGLATEGVVELPHANRFPKPHPKIDLGGDIASQYVSEDRE